MISQPGLTALNHEKINQWINPFKGIQSLHKKTNMIINGNIDDVWTDNEKCYQLFLKVFQEIIRILKIVYGQGIRQLSLYGYLLQNNNLEIGNFGIIAVINTEEDLDHSSLNFKFYLFKKNLELNWIETTLSEIKILLENDNFQIFLITVNFVII